MTQLGGSETEANLRAAFARESASSRRFLYFAQQADVEGEPETAALFRAAAERESGHAIGNLDFLVDVGDPGTGLPLGSTEENLAAAEAGGRSDADDMYPGMVETARAEGFGEIADWFESLAQASRVQIDRFRAAQDGQL